MDLFRLTWGVYRKVMWVVFPAQLLDTLVIFYQNRFASASAPFWLFFCILMTGSAVLTYATHHLQNLMVAAKLNGNNLSISDAKKIYFSRVPELVRICFFATFKVIAGLLLGVIPGLIWSCRYFMILPSWYLESPHVNVLEVSRIMMRRRGWAISVTLICAVAINFGVASGATLVVKRLGYPDFWASSLINIIFQFFIGALFFLVYQKYRAEVSPEITEDVMSSPLPTWGQGFKWLGVTCGLGLLWVALIGTFFAL